jgi:hypothetical protein
MTTKTATDLFLSKLSDEDRAVFERCRVSRGKRKGALKRNAPSPSKDLQAYAAWHAFRACVHYAQWGNFPSNVGLYGIVAGTVLGGQKPTEIYDRIVDAAIYAIENSRG